MFPRKTFPVVWASLLAVSAAAAAPGPPDRSKARRVGFVVETEGGVDGPQSVFIPEKKSGESAAPAPLPPVRREVAPGAKDAPAGPPVAGAPAQPARMTDDAGRPAPFFMTRTERDAPDAALNRMSRREENLSERRFDPKRSDLLDSRFDPGSPVKFGAWGRATESFPGKKNESVDTGARFDTPMVGRETVTFDRLERKVSQFSGERAEVRNFGRHDKPERAAGYDFGESGSSLQSRLAAGYSLMTRVSMQDINRYQFRRNRSTEKGALPAAAPGREARPIGAASDGQ